MALFSSSSSISLGITFSNENILSVRLDENRGIILNKEQLPAETMEQGVILNEQGVVSALVKVVHPEGGEADAESDGQVIEQIKPKLRERLMFWKRQKKNAGDDLGAAICVPPEAVYTAVFAVSSVVGKNLAEEVLERVTLTIPVDPEDVTVLWKQIGKTDDEQYIGVAAMSTSLLQQYNALCDKQKLRLECVTTPASTIWLSAASRQKDTSVLIARLEGVSAISAVMYNTWPVDELALPERADLDEQIQQTKLMMLQQYNMHGIDPKRIVFIGSDEEFAYLQQVMGNDIPVERTTFAVPSRMVGYELGLFPILSARKDKLINMLDGSTIEA